MAVEKKREFPLKKCLTPYDGLTEEFIEEALVYMKKLHGDKHAIDEYIIHFDPL